jgi:Spy/CpxP family protein refolding chaperone
MRNLRTFGIALLLISLAIVPAFAKHHGPYGPFDHDAKKMGKIERLKQALDLTSQQEADIREIMTASRAETKPLRQAVKENREEIRNTINAETLNETQLRELLHQQAERQTNLMIARHAVHEKIDKILTAEQREKREAFRRQHMAHRQHRRGAGMETDRDDT